MMSFATADSDPGPAMRPRDSPFGISRMTSVSLLRTGPKLNAISAGELMARDFHNRPNMDGSGTISTSSMQMHQPVAARTIPRGLYQCPLCMFYIRTQTD